MEKWVRLLPALGTALAVGVLLFVFFQNDGVGLNWGSGTALVFIAAFGFAVAAILRFSIAQLVEPQPLPASADGHTLLRRRLAPLVIGIGTLGILIVAVAVLVGISTRPGAQPPDESVYLGIFSSVIPVFATWVGAVIAFYFSNESFRQAAEASGALKGDASDSEPITSPTRMIPLEKITHYELKASVDPTTNKEVLEDPANVSYGTISPLFSAAVSRVIILTPNKRAVRIIREKLVPAGMDANATLARYFAHDQNASDSLNFKTIPETATVGEARAMKSLYKLADIFVTKTGGVDEPIRGWVPDDKLA